MKVELLLARDDHTWDTEVVDFPDEIADRAADSDLDAEVVLWANRELSKFGYYRNVVMFAVYHYPEPEEIHDGS